MFIRILPFGKRLALRLKKISLGHFWATLSSLNDFWSSAAPSPHFPFLGLIRCASANRARNTAIADDQQREMKQRQQWERANRTFATGPIFWENSRINFVKRPKIHGCEPILGL
ncbi:MAG: hypothetical protein ACYDH9_25560 [Limisphaerales bacterium]